MCEGLRRKGKNESIIISDGVFQIHFSKCLFQIRNKSLSVLVVQIPNGADPEGVCLRELPRINQFALARQVLVQEFEVELWVGGGHDRSDDAPLVLLLHI